MEPEAEKSNPVTDSFLVFCRSEVAILEALSLTFFPEPNPIGISGNEAQVPLYLDQYVSKFSFFVRAGIRVLVRITNWIPVFLFASGRTFRKMKIEQRERFLSRWRSSRRHLFRLLFHGIKLFFATAYFNHPEVLHRIGYYEVCPPPKG